MTTAASSDAPVRDAATLLLVRPGDHGAVEVLLVRRHADSGFAADAWVFPGGVVDPIDAALAPERWTGIVPRALTDRFGAGPELVLALHVAAVRETFEEAGLLLASRADGSPLDLAGDRAAAVRADLADRSGTGGFNGWLAEEDAVLDLGALELWARWITPRSEPRRYDTYFFVARAPAGQVARHDAVETTGQRWIAPRAALDKAVTGELQLMYPTIKVLEELAAAGTTDEVLDHAAARPRIRTVLPHVDQGPDGQWRILHPDDPGFPTHLYADELAASGQIGEQE